MLNESPISKVIVTNTLPSADDLLLSPKFKVLSIAQILADAIKRITANRSVSELFAKDDEGEQRGPAPPADAIGLPNILIPASSATR